MEVVLGHIDEIGGHVVYQDFVILDAGVVV